MKNTLEYKGFIGSVHFSEEDGVFCGKIEGIADLITFEGASVKELTRAFHKAAKDYLALCEKTGKTYEKSYKGGFNIRISPELHKMAVRQSFRLGISLNQFVQQAIEDELRKGLKSREESRELLAVPGLLTRVRESSRALRKGNMVSLEAARKKLAKKRTGGSEKGK